MVLVVAKTTEETGKLIQLIKAATAATVTKKHQIKSAVLN